MQTRIIQTRFYKDSVVQQLSLYAQHLFIYLLTSEHINISGVFELPDSYILLESKLSTKQLQDAKSELSAHKKVLFFEGWVNVVNAEKNNQYRKSPSNEVAYQREMARVPARVLEIFRDLLDSSVDSSVKSTVDSTYKSEIRNKNIINNIESSPIVKAKLPGYLEELTESILPAWNQVTGERHTSGAALLKGYELTRRNYSLEQVLEAIHKKPTLKNDFLREIGLSTIFRQRNKSGDCDYIADILASRTQDKPTKKFVNAV